MAIHPYEGECKMPSTITDALQSHASTDPGQEHVNNALFIADHIAWVIEAADALTTTDVQVHFDPDADKVVKFRTYKNGRFVFSIIVEAATGRAVIESPDTRTSENIPQDVDDFIDQASRFIDNA